MCMFMCHKNHTVLIGHMCLDAFRMSFFAQKLKSWQAASRFKFISVWINAESNQDCYWKKVQYSVQMRCWSTQCKLLIVATKLTKPQQRNCVKWNQSDTANLQKSTEIMVRLLEAYRLQEWRFVVHKDFITDLWALCVRDCLETDVFRTTNDGRLQ